MIVAAGLILVWGVAAADCMRDGRGEVICGKGQCQRDRHGAVMCSAFRNGSAVRTRDGRILCGRGECVKTMRGEVFCSTVPEGAAQKDLMGVPRCEGQCEPGSAEYCEAVIAGTAQH
jgi:hypothetical protein